MKLREYQEYAIDAVLGRMQNSTPDCCNFIVAMPTGTGKSVVIAGLIKRILREWSSVRCLVLTHVKELIKQNFDKFRQLWPGAPAGIYSAGLKIKQTFSQVTFGGVASVIKAIDLFGRIDILFIDECHLLNPNAESMYQELIKRLKEKNPNLIVIGLSATPFRLGLGYLTEGEVFHDFAVNMCGMREFNWFVDNGYLAPLIPHRTSTQVDVQGVKIVHGDYAQGELEKATERMTWEACREMAELAHNRRAWLVFCAGVDNAEHAADYLNRMGVKAAAIHSRLEDGQREDRLAAFKRGDIQAITNYNVLTTGFDDARIDMLGILRKTCSAALWVQMLGRGTRPLYADGMNLDNWQDRLMAIQASGRRNCLVLDFAANTPELGPINDPVIPKKKGEGKGDAPVKFCDKDKLVFRQGGCGAYNHTSARFCCDCGAEFEFATNFTAKAGTVELIKTEVPEFAWFDVDMVVYNEYKKKGDPDAIPVLQVIYHCGNKRFMQHLCFEHVGWIQRQALRWWSDRMPLEYISFLPSAPTTVHEAAQFARTLRQPRRVRVQTNKDHPEIVNIEFKEGVTV